MINAITKDKRHNQLAARQIFKIILVLILILKKNHEFRDVFYSHRQTKDNLPRSIDTPIRIFTAASQNTPVYRPK